MVTSKIVDLRQLLAARFPQEPLSPNERFLTGLAGFDETPAAGLTKSAITELICPPSQAGSATLIAALLEQTAKTRQFLALIDGSDSFTPDSLGNRALRHLLWLRCRKANEAMQAADVLLRDGNFPLVILDLALNPAAELRRIPSSHWYRLQRLVELAPTAFLVFSRQSLVSSAQWKFLLENRWKLEQLDLPRQDLAAGLRLKLQRAQPNKWREEFARAG